MTKECLTSIKLAHTNELRLDWTYQFLTREEIQDFAAARLPDNFQALRLQLLEGTFKNQSEGRNVSHVLSRSINSVVADSKRSRFAEIARKLRSGNWRGATGKQIHDVVNIGVGGSDLGPLMASFALSEFATDIQRHRLNTHFVSSMDGGQLYTLLPDIDPETTVFIVASKSFSTVDTLANLDTVRAWVKPAFDCANKDEKAWFAHHVIGVSANPIKMTQMGIAPAHQLTFGQSVGGRFSMWTAIGLAIATSCGVQVFERMLAGARAMDEHFLNAPVTENIPLLMALLGVYNREKRGINNLAVLPYDGRFRFLPDYIQQLDMESNGKTCDFSGTRVIYPTGPIIWGGLGPNGQHAFFQHLHQGYDKFSADFIMVRARNAKKFDPTVGECLIKQQDLAVANCLAHRRLMAFGHQGNTARDCYEGGHPSSVLAMETLSPEAFGGLIAAYEHKVFTQGVIWRINSFDQPGVERGKLIADEILKRMQGESEEVFDASTESFLSNGSDEKKSTETLRKKVAWG